MNKYIHLLKAKLNKYIIQSKWIIDSFILTRKYRKNSYYPKELETDKLNNILIIVPHADDDIIGCFPILRSSQKVFLYYIGNYKINDPLMTKKRDNEFRNLMEFFNHEVISHITDDHSENIKKAIIDYKISTIFSPDYIDWHEDHQIATTYLLHALMGNISDINIFTYTITVPHSPRGNKYFIPYSEAEQKIKWDLFKRYYPSQAFMPVKRFMINERINASSISGDIYAADIYESFSINQLNESFNNKPDQLHRKGIYGLINNLQKIHNYRQ